MLATEVGPLWPRSGYARRAFRQYSRPEGEPVEAAPCHLPPPRSAARAVLRRACAPSDRAFPGDRPPARRAAQPAGRGGMGHRRRRAADRAARRRPRPRRPLPPAWLATRPHAPKGEPLTPDDLTHLVLLRLAAVAASPARD